MCDNDVRKLLKRLLQRSNSARKIAQQEAPQLKVTKRRKDGLETPNYVRKRKEKEKKERDNRRLCTTCLEFYDITKKKDNKCGNPYHPGQS